LGIAGLGPLDDVHDLHSLTEIAFAVEVDLVYYRLIHRYLHHFLGDLADIVPAHFPELVEVVAAVEVVAVDGGQPVPGILHPDQDHDGEGDIHDVPDGTQEPFMFEGIVDLIDHDYCLRIVIQELQAVLEDVVGGAAGDELTQSEAAVEGGHQIDREGLGSGGRFQPHIDVTPHEGDAAGIGGLAQAGLAVDQAQAYHLGLGPVHQELDAGIGPDYVLDLHELVGFH